MLLPAGANRGGKKLNPHVKLWKTLFPALIGAMYPTSMRINEEGRLVVNFKTEARFRGQFVMSHPGKRAAPMHTHTHPLNLSNVVILYSDLLLDYPVAHILSSSISGAPL